MNRNAFLISAALTLSLISCKKDDDSGTNNGNNNQINTQLIVNTWDGVKVDVHTKEPGIPAKDTTYDISGQQYEFKSDGTFDVKDSHAIYGTSLWALTGTNTMLLTDTASSVAYTATILKLTNNEFKFKYTETSTSQTSDITINLVK